MDKETLSNYGWIVICVLVLAVMIALASPFGSYVASAVENTTQGLFDVQQGALSAADIDIADQSFEGGSDTTAPDPALNPSGIIPEGATYTSADGTVYNAGDTMPTISAGDVFVYGDYQYCYGFIFDYECNAWTNVCGCGGKINGWGVRVLDTTKTEYGAILDSINGQPITNMYAAFIYCTDLTTAPAIPSNVTDISYAFAYCYNLTTAPVIPSSVTNMSYTFWNCTSLKTAPVIPSSVIYMSSTFQDCTALTGDIEINATPTIYGYCLLGTQVTSISGDCAEVTKTAILATK